jgi:hypothetical protein
MDEVLGPLIDSDNLPPPGVLSASRASTLIDGTALQRVSDVRVHRVATDNGGTSSDGGGGLHTVVIVVIAIIGAFGAALLFAGLRHVRKSGGVLVTLRSMSQSGRRSASALATSPDRDRSSVVVDDRDLTGAAALHGGGHHDVAAIAMRDAGDTATATSTAAV